MANGQPRPSDLAGSLRGRAKGASQAVRQRAAGLASVIEETRGIDDSLRKLIVSGIPDDMPPELVARLAVVWMRSGNGLRDDLHDLFSIYLDAAIAAERKSAATSVCCDGTP